MYVNFRNVVLVLVLLGLALFGYEFASAETTTLILEGGIGTSENWYGMAENNDETVFSRNDYRVVVSVYALIEKTTVSITGSQEDQPSVVHGTLVNDPVFENGTWVFQVTPDDNEKVEVELHVATTTFYPGFTHNVSVQETGEVIWHSWRATVYKEGFYLPIVGK